MTSNHSPYWRRVGRYEVKFVALDNSYIVEAPDGLVISTHPTMADAIDAAKRYVAGDKRRRGK